jgi:hypothetical protein
MIGLDNSLYVITSNCPFLPTNFGLSFGQSTVVILPPDFDTFDLLSSRLYVSHFRLFTSGSVSCLSRSNAFACSLSFRSCRRQRQTTVIAFLCRRRISLLISASASSHALSLFRPPRSTNHTNHL